MQIKLKNNLRYVKIFNINISIMLKWKKEKDLEKISKGDKELIVMKERIKDFSEDPLLVGLYDEEKAREQINAINIEAAEEKGTKQAKIEIAKNMLAENADISFICKVTNLTKEELEKLK